METSRDKSLPNRVQKIFFLLAGLLLLSNSLMASDTLASDYFHKLPGIFFNLTQTQEESKQIFRVPHPPIQVYYNQPGLETAQSLVTSLIEKGIHPNEILVVFDIDDTLILDKSAGTHGGVYQPRKHATELVNFLYDQGVKLLVSSANSWAEGSFRKLNDIHVLEKFGVTEIPKKLKFNIKKVTYRNRTKTAQFRYYQVGHVIGATKIRGCEPDPFYKRKAIATQIALDSDSTLNGVRRIVFVDDSKLYVHIYQQDVQKYLIFDNGVEQVDCIDLTSPFAPQQQLASGEVYNNNSIF